jgi:hypothetical protein
VRNVGYRFVLPTKEPHRSAPADETAETRR